MKKTITILLANLIIALSAQAQNFGGKVLNEDGESIPYAGVTILEVADSSVVAATLADADGNFSFETYYEYCRTDHLVVRFHSYDIGHASFGFDLSVRISDRTCNQNGIFIGFCHKSQIL